MFPHRAPNYYHLCLTFAVLFGTVPDSHAQVMDCTTSSSTETKLDSDNIPICSSLLPETSSPWNFGLGVGYGERGNPLINSDNIPIYGIVQLAYTGDRFFFDNGDVGAFLFQGDSWELNAIAGLGGERSFYSFLNSSSVSFDPVFGGVESGDALGIPASEVIVGSPDEEGLVPIRLKPPKRDYTVDGGIEMLVNFEHSELQIQLLTDISGQHHGQELWVSWGKLIKSGRWRVSPSLGFTLKSSEAADYFYGVRKSEAYGAISEYHTDSALNPFVRISASYRLDNHWKLVSTLSYEHLDDTLVASPIVVDDHTSTAFLGIYYEF